MPPVPVPWTYRVLLIGIDGYPRRGKLAARSLRGCVADVDYLTDILIALGIPTASLQKLISPGLASRPRYPSESAATAQQIFKALEGLTDSQPGDRVLIFYAGHGMQQQFGDRRVEALVAEDGLPIWDWEFARLCDAIYARTHDLTVILDCCCAAGMLRSSSLEQTERKLEWAELGLTPPSLPAPDLWRGDGFCTRLRGSLYTAIAAAGSNLPAFESAQCGRVLGNLTRALGTTLHERASSLTAYTDSSPRWSDIWARIDALARSYTQNLPQQPQLLGPLNNRVLGGPPGPHNDAVPLQLLPGAKGDAAWTLAAGWEVGFEVGARLRAYATLPAEPTVGDAREVSSVGHLVITSAEFGSSTAGLLPGADAGALAGACFARVVRPAPLSVGLAAELPAELCRELLTHAETDDLSYRLGAAHAESRVRLGCTSDTIWLGGPLHDWDSCRTPGPLWKHHYDRDRPSRFAASVRGVLRHYARHIAPLDRLRDYLQSPTGAFPGLSLRVEYGPATDDPRTPPIRDRAPVLPNGRVKLLRNQDLVLVARNTSRYRLRLALIELDYSGSVRRLDRLFKRQELDAESDGELISGDFSTLGGWRIESYFLLAATESTALEPLDKLLTEANEFFSTVFDDFALGRRKGSGTASPVSLSPHGLPRLWGTYLELENRDWSLHVEQAD